MYIFFTLTHLMTNLLYRTIPLRITWQPLSMFKWQLYAAQTMKSQWAHGGALGSMLYGESSGEGLDEDQDSLKEAMLDTNPYLLGMTFVVSIVHSIFEFLAFKNGNEKLYMFNFQLFQFSLSSCRYSILAKS